MVTQKPYKHDICIYLIIYIYIHRRTDRQIDRQLHIRWIDGSIDRWVDSIAGEIETGRSN